MGRKLSFCKEQVLAEAARLFCANGYEKTCMRDIARALNIPIASLYHSFGDKEALLIEVMEKYIALYVQPAMGVLKDAPAVVPALHAYFEGAIQPMQCDGRREGCMLMHAATELGEVAPRAAALAQRTLRYMHHHFVQMVERGQAAGDVAADRSAEFFGMHVMGILTSIKAWQRMGMEAEKLRDYAQQAVQVLEVRG
jgi:TetR/AcrR family transcriptional repressor of nem operon